MALKYVLLWFSIGAMVHQSHQKQVCSRPDFQLIDGMCFKMMSDMQSWESAKSNCSDVSATLAEPRSDIDNEAIKKVDWRGVQVRRSFWIGALKAGSGSDTKFVWQSDEQALSYKKWADNEPNNNGGDENCVEYYTTHGVWNDRRCDIAQNYICQMKPCSDGFQAIGGVCYKLISDKKTWAKASSSCKEMNAFLAEPRSAAQNAAVTRLGKKLPPNQAIWLGAMYSSSDNRWAWESDGGVVRSDDTYQHWGSGEPNNHASNESCMEFWNGYNAWNDKRCNIPQNYICQQSKFV